MGKVSSAVISLIILLTAIGAAGAVSVENVTKLNLTDTDLWDPVLSPDGTKIAYATYDEAHNQQVFVINTNGTGKTKLTNGAIKKWGLVWGPDKIAYVSYGQDGLEKIFVINPNGTDNKQLIPDSTRQGNPSEDKPPVWAAPSWSPDGKSLVYTSFDETMNQKMYIVNADGTGKRLILNDASRQWSPAFSPDGKNITYVSYNNRFKEELFVVDTAGNAKRQLTFDEIKKNNPIWGPDGTITYVSFESISSSGEKIFVINQNGTNKRLFVDSGYKQRNPSFSHDGKRFSYATIDTSGAVKIAVGDIAGITAAATPTPIATALATPAATTSTAITPIVTLTRSAQTATETPIVTPTIKETQAGSSNAVGMIFIIFIIYLVLTTKRSKK